MHSFIDEARIHVRGGNGGNGAAHFRREKFVPMGGPDGGDGGHGGDVIVRADRELNTLISFRRHRRFAAEDGQPGGPQRMSGRSGQDLIVAVPVGTVIRDADSGEELGDLLRDGQTLPVAQGGQGGLGNVHFKSSTNQAPGFAELGEPGRERWLELELKVIADAGIVGLPNAGKSTLLSVMSAARPKIAGYPFTTLVPNLGVVDTGEYSFVAADIPGLIEGAHEGVGLGHEFLRHIERTRVLLHVLDGGEADPMAAFTQINEELRRYDERLAQRLQLVVVNKMDLPEARERWPELARAFAEMGFEAVAVSAATREGIEALIYRTASMVQETPSANAAPDVPEETDPVITIRPNPDHFEIERRRKTFRVTGETVERLAVMTNFESEEAVHRLQQRLRRMGVFTALQRAGVQEGSTIRIGDRELIWDSSYDPEPRRRRR